MCRAGNACERMSVSCRAYSGTPTATATQSSGKTCLHIVVAARPSISQTTVSNKVTRVLKQSLLKS